MTKIWNMIGTMSGTSCDGLDLAHCTFWQERENWQYKIEATESEPYSREWLQKIAEVNHLETKAYQQFDEEYGMLNAERITKFIAKNSIANLDAIVSHGHTIYHVPKVKSIQAGNGQVIADTLNIPVIADLRNADISANGQGAPIVPIADMHLFAEHKFCLNLGGIANVSVKTGSEILAWDVTACNLMLNYFSQKLGKEYDENGALAEAGKVNSELLSEMLDWKYLKQASPKSLEATHVKEWVRSMDSEEVSVQDQLRTSVAFIAQSLKQAIEHNCSASDSILVTGGGGLNGCLIQELNSVLPLSVKVPSKEVVDFKEAMAMAFYGVLRLSNIPNCLSSVTGARENVVGGELFLPNLQSG